MLLARLAEQRDREAQRSTLEDMRAVARTARYWGPLLVGFLCFIAVQFVGPLVGWLLVILGFALMFDGTTAMWARAGSAGNLSSHRQ